MAEYEDELELEKEKTEESTRFGSHGMKFKLKSSENQTTACLSTIDRNSIPNTNDFILDMPTGWSRALRWGLAGPPTEVQLSPFMSVGATWDRSVLGVPNGMPTVPKDGDRLLGTEFEIRKSVTPGYAEASQTQPIKDEPKTLLQNAQFHRYAGVLAGHYAANAYEPGKMTFASPANLDNFPRDMRAALEDGQGSKAASDEQDTSQANSLPQMLGPRTYDGFVHWYQRQEEAHGGPKPFRAAVLKPFRKGFDEATDKRFDAVKKSKFGEDCKDRPDPKWKMSKFVPGKTKAPRLEEDFK